MTETYGDDFPYSEYKKIIKQRFANRFGGKNLPVKPYVTELLEYLSCGGYKIAVASSTKTDEIKRRLSETGLRKYFDVVLGGDTVSKSKPNPDIFLKAIKELQIERENAFVIEDSHNGIRAAYKAGIKGIMVPDLLMPDDEIKQKAFKIFDNLCDVKAYFESLEI